MATRRHARIRSTRIPSALTVLEAGALAHAAELFRDVLDDANVDVADDSALAIGHAKLVAAVEREQPVEVSLAEALIDRAERAERNEMTLRVALKLVTSPGLALPEIPSCSRGRSYRLAQAHSSIEAIAEATLDATAWDMPALRAFGDQFAAQENGSTQQ